MESVGWGYQGGTQNREHTVVCECLLLGTWFEQLRRADQCLHGCDLQLGS